MCERLLVGRFLSVPDSYAAVRLRRRHPRQRARPRIFGNTVGYHARLERYTGVAPFTSSSMRQQSDSMTKTQLITPARPCSFGTDVQRNFADAREPVTSTDMGLSIETRLRGPCSRRIPPMRARPCRRMPSVPIYRASSVKSAPKASSFLEFHASTRRRMASLIASVGSMGLAVCR